MNTLKTTALLGLLMGLSLAFGYLIGDREGLFFGFIIGGGLTLISYFFSDKIALAAAHAQPVSQADAPELYEIVQRLSQRAGLPMPRLYFSNEQAPNAFATGRNPRHGVVCVTAGLMNMMSQPELEGVIAHELSHIKHRDILISTVAAIMAGAIAAVARMMLWFGGGRNNRDSGPLGLIGTLLMIILAPIAAMLIQLAISRSREYAADESGAQIAGSPLGLINALKKLEPANRQIPMDISPATSHMYIVMPLTADGAKSLFRTHPSIESRIAKLLPLLQHQSQNPYATTI